MRRPLTCCALGGALLAVPASASADQVAPSSSRMVGAGAAVTACGALAGVGIAWTSVDNVVTAVRLSALPAGCTGASLSLTLASSAGTALGAAGPVSVGGTSLTLTPSGSPTATAVAAAYLSAVGP